MRRTAVLLALLALAGCGGGGGGGGGGSSTAGAGNGSSAPSTPTPDPNPPANTDVTVDLSTTLATMPVNALGIHTSVYDSGIADVASGNRLVEAGVMLLRYPGGGYADNYHWSTHSLTRWHNGDTGWLGTNSDFGRFVTTMERIAGTAMITVNYGTNQVGSPTYGKRDVASTGPGEPKEAAAWVAYANGSPSDATVIGLDSTGNDWKTVGYWASLRAAAPLASDDGKNFLRLNHAAPFAIKHWEIGNEIFGNGYYGSNYEEDLHAPYDDTTAQAARKDHAGLSPTAYGTNAAAFIRAMKAVDPTIKVGVVLTSPGYDTWDGTHPWNPDVLRACGTLIDFGIVHYYPGGSNVPVVADLLAAPAKDIPTIVSGLRAQFAQYCGANATNVGIAVTETGPNGLLSAPAAAALFAADDYATWIENGAFNIDWLEYHSSDFLSDTGEPGSAYYGLKLVHRLALPGDKLVRTSSTLNLIRAHAAQRADGSVRVMLINQSPIDVARFSVQVSGGTSGFVPTLGEGFSASTDPMSLSATSGSSFTITMPAHTVMVIVLTPSSSSSTGRSGSG